MSATRPVLHLSQETSAEPLAEKDRGRLLETLECVLEIPAGDLKTVLSDACDLLANALEADKVDAFLFEPARECLVAVGVSDQPLSRLQRKLGMDVVPIANRGRTVQIFETGRSYHSGRVDQDPEELLGVKHSLGVRSQISVALDVGGARRGVISVVSQQPGLWGSDEVRFVESVVRWIGVVAHRSELLEASNRDALEQGRRSAAEELITVVAHDIRNLLSPIDGRLELLRLQAEQAGRSGEIEELRHASGSVSRMRNLVTDILDVARLDNGLFELAREPVDIAQLARSVAATLSVPDRAVRVEVRGDVTASADPARVRQCLENLIGNCVSHSPPGAEIDVVLSRQDDPRDELGRAELVVVEVVDRGPGVPHRILPQIFERYVAGESSGGIGLGMYLAKQIATVHGGDLTVHSELGKGTRFVLSLPARKLPH